MGYITVMYFFNILNYFLMQKYEDVLYASNSAFVILSAL